MKNYICLIALVALILPLAPLSAVAQMPYFSSVNADIDWLTLEPPRSPHSGELVNDKGSFQFAQCRKINASANNSGSLASFDDGLLTWVVGFCTSWCESINVTLANAHLAPDETIYVYSPSGNQVQTFTWNDNQPNGYLQSLPIVSDSLIVEFHSASGRAPEFCVQSVNLGFLPTELSGLPLTRANRNKALGSVGASAECNINASCYPDAVNLTRATCRLLINGNLFGTGELIRNTADDATPYILTSAHCLGDEEFKTCIARFGFEYSKCQDEAAFASYEEISGATQEVFIESRDVALLRLSKAPSAAMRPYWVGWNLEQKQTGKPFCIHHPSGDAMKVSVAADLVEGESYNGKSAFGKAFDRYMHWRVTKWAVGTTEGGSSGSGLYNKQYQLIGCLSGGNASCGVLSSDYFWQLGKSWFATGSTSKTLADCLDPLNTGTTSVTGTYYLGAVPQDVFNVNTQSNPISELLLDSEGYVVGNNDYHTEFVAEQFDTHSEAFKVEGVYVASSRKQQYQTASPELIIWSDKNGQPDQVIYRQTISRTKFANRSMIYIELDEPQLLTGRFYVGVSIVESSRSSERAAYYYYKGTEQNTAFIFANGAWRTYDYFVPRIKTTEEQPAQPVNCGLFFGLRVQKSTADTVSNTRLEDVSIVRHNHVLHIRSNEILGLGLTSANGSKCYEANELRVQHATVDMQGLASGIYVLQVHLPSGKRTFKILNTK